MIDEEPDDLFGLFEKQNALRMVRRAALAFVVLLILSTIVWALQHHWRDTPVEKAQKDLDFITKHHGTEVERCEAEDKLAQAYRDARDDQNYDMHAMTAHLCAVKIDQDRRLGNGS